jgi:DNA-binding transcriptional LysR family regulator
MQNTTTLDQLRALITVAETGSFSAAARQLRRVQSAVSQSMANLEAQLGLVLWDRSTRRPTLTEAGRVILAAAQRVCAEVDGLHNLAAELHKGLEPEVSLCVDALFPVAALVELGQDFARAFPAVNLRVQTETLTAVAARVLSGQATLGVALPLAQGKGLERRVLAPVRMLAVVAAKHPLSRQRGKVSTSRLQQEIQIVLSERGEEGIPDQAVLSARTWRVFDLHTKHALLLGGLGWGNLPEHLIRDDLHTGRLVRIHPAAWGQEEHTLYLAAIYRPSTTLGPAHRWMLTRLEELCLREARAGRT